jgi:lipopolysaccharide transport system ATP-binding protein
MMGEVAIRVEGLSKKFEIGHQISGDMRQAISSRFKNLFSVQNNFKESFWALDDINFEIKKGEAIGIIGRNGAGKSTLLKILSRITEPTKGRFEINGRVSSLLEVGTGFHPELSGRENIFLNGTILGMKRSEIKAKFDQIVDFSGVEKFIDTPVKHYSSGMKVRLAFSVAAHLEPEILIIDEVLAVGDAEFQKKCLGKMDDVSKNEGRTILFVSHGMAAVKKLCTSTAVFEQGKIEFWGETNDGIRKYLSRNNELDNSGFKEWKVEDSPGKNEFKLSAVRLKNQKNEIKSSFSEEESIIVELDYILTSSIEKMRVNFRLLSREEDILFSSSSEHLETPKKQSGRYKTSFYIPAKILNSGFFRVFLHAGCPGEKELMEGESFLEFEIVKTQRPNVSDVQRLPGFFAPEIRCEISRMD